MSEFAPRLSNPDSTLSNGLAWLARRKTLTLFALILAVSVAYVPVLSGEFLWDDTFLVGKNPFFRSPIFFLEVFRHWLFLDSFSGYYRPVQNWSYMLDYWVWNQNSFGYHLSNILFHAFAAWLLIVLLQRTLVAWWPEAEESRRHALALLVGMLWAIHPIHNAAVAYIAGRADTLAMIFVLMGWLAWLHGRTHTGVKRVCFLGLAWMAALLGILSKEIAIVWFAFFLFTTIGFSPQLPKKEKLGVALALLTVLGAYLALRLNLPTRSPQPAFESPLSTRALMALRALGDYGALIFWPENLHMERMIYQPSILQSAHSWVEKLSFHRLTLAGGLVIALFTAGLVWKSPGQKVRFVAVLWFFVGFLPISNLFPLNAQSAEHWIYMPSIGFILFVVSLIFDAPPSASRWIISLLILALIPLIIRTNIRSRDWTSPTRFYSTTIDQGGGTWRSYTNLAMQYLYAGRGDEAEALLRRTLRYAPISVVKITLGQVLYLENKVAEARTYLDLPRAELPKILHEHPNNWRACRIIADLDASEGHYEKALNLLDAARKERPDVWDLFKLQVEIRARSGHQLEAIEQMRAFLRENWWHYDAHLLLATLLNTSGQPSDAVAILEETARLDIHNSEPFQQISQVELGRMNFSAALDAARKAVERSGGLPGDYIQLARVYDAMGQKQQAQAIFEKARAVGSEQKRQDLGNFL